MNLKETIDSLIDDVVETFRDAETGEATVTGRTGQVFRVKRHRRGLMVYPTREDARALDVGRLKSTNGGE